MSTTELIDPRLILSKVSKCEDRPPPGRLRGTATVEVAFDLKIGEPFTKRVTQAIPWQRIATLALARLNDATQQSVLREALDESLDLKDAASRAAALVEGLLETTERECQGMITGTTAIVSAQVHLL